MPEEENLVISVNSPLGEVMVVPEVIEVIIGITASRVEGVYGVCGMFVNSVNELLGRVTHGKGVYLRAEEEGLRVDIYCYLNYDAFVPEIALEMQDRAKQQVLFMTDIDLVEVNIHVAAVVPEKIPRPGLDKLLPKDEDGEENE